MTKKELMTVEDFIAEFSISRSSFYQEVKAKKIRITKLNSRTYITRDNALSWMNSLQVE